TVEDERDRQRDPRVAERLTDEPPAFSSRRDQATKEWRGLFPRIRHADADAQEDGHRRLEEEPQLPSSSQIANDPLPEPDVVHHGGSRYRCAVKDASIRAMA